MMGKKIIAVNAGPRKSWNTDTLIEDAIKGAEAAGAEVRKFDLFRLEKYTGCISCFGCKREKNKGHCICRDGLTPVLDAIREADGLIIGSPNYLGELTASFRALYERLVFQNLTYRLPQRSRVKSCRKLRRAARHTKRNNVGEYPQSGVHQRKRRSPGSYHCVQAF